MTTANQTGTSCDELQMLSIAGSTRLGMGEPAPFDHLDSGSFGRLRSFPLKGSLWACALIQWVIVLALRRRRQVPALPASPGMHSPTAGHLRRSTSS